jgi:MoaA/NifB/PqqE/SkfB family radical SAM enzyme
MYYSNIIHSMSIEKQPENVGTNDIFKEGYDSSNNQDQEVNLRTYERLKAVSTPDEVRTLLLEMAAEEGHPGDLRIPMPEYDAGIVVYKDALLKKLEDYLKRVGAVK